MQQYRDMQECSELEYNVGCNGKVYGYGIGVQRGKRVDRGVSDSKNDSIK